MVKSEHPIVGETIKRITQGNVCLDLNQHAEIACRLSIVGKAYTPALGHERRPLQ